MSEFILVSKNKSVATLTLNRPEKRNALNGKMIKEILHVLKLIREDTSIRILMINGNGDHFCSGADIAWMQTIATGSYEENYDDAQNFADLMYQLYSFPKPTIVLAHGATRGGGLGILAACDIAIASENANFGFSEVKIGVTPSTISPYVIAAIGERAAHYYFLTGKNFNGNDAHQIGLINKVVDDKLLLQTGEEIAKMILQNGPQALIAAKQLIRHVARERITEDLAQKTAEHLSNVRTTKEAQEGLRAFLEKRTPAWQGEG